MDLAEASCSLIAPAQELSNELIQKLYHKVFLLSCTFRKTNFTFAWQTLKIPEYAYRSFSKI